LKVVAATEKERPKTLVLGVTGGIACYKAVELVRLLVRGGFAVQVATRSGPLTWQALVTEALSG